MDKLDLRFMRLSIIGIHGNVALLSVLVGGNLNNGTNAGVWCRNLNNALSNANWNIGARLSAKHFVLYRVSPYVFFRQ